MADPTVADVFNQLVLVNGKLDQIDTNTFGQAAAINNLDGDVNKGFKATVDALKTLALLDIEAIKLIFHLTQQTDTMICALEHISKNTCELVTQSTLQTQLQTRMRDDIEVMRLVAESGNPAAALELQRLAALRAQVEKCCPSERPPRACNYEPCPQPKRIGMPELPRIPQNPDDTTHGPN
jgi:hypothetical protein